MISNLRNCSESPQRAPRSQRKAIFFISGSCPGTLRDFFGGLFSIRSNACILLMGVAALILGGCAADRTADRLMASQNENIALREENVRLSKELTQTKATVEEQREQIANMNRLGPGRFAELTRVSSIELDRQTGGYDKTMDGVDDGINVYLLPKDAQGHVIKVAGELEVQLYELDGEPRLIGKCRWNAKELESRWVSRFLANHYFVQCPFKTPPKSKNITVQVKFIELLTGKPFVVQKMVTIRLAGDKEKKSGKSL